MAPPKERSAPRAQPSLSPGGLDSGQTAIQKNAVVKCRAKTKGTAVLSVFPSTPVYGTNQALPWRTISPQSITYPPTTGRS